MENQFYLCVHRRQAISNLIHLIMVGAFFDIRALVIEALYSIRTVRRIFTGLALITLVPVIYASDIPCTPEGTFEVGKLKSHVIVISELHGTNEIPDLVGRLACTLVKNGKKLIVGLEIPTDRQDAINRYMASEGSDQDIATLIHSDFGKLEDGRSSQAILRLVETLRRIRQSGALIAVMGYDISVGSLPIPLFKNEQIWSGERDLAMARNIESRARVYGDFILLNLVGAFHASKSKGVAWNSEYEPMAYLLSQRIPIHSISVEFAGGTAWGCLKPKPDGAMNCLINSVGKFTKNDDIDVDTWMSLGVVSASVPMRRK